MCGRFHNHVQAMRDWVQLLSGWPGDFETRYNVAPTTQVPIITRDGVVPARWGMVPRWAKQFDSNYATFNARIESAAEKPTFRIAWKEGLHCLVPSAGYFEWKTENGEKQPYFIHAPDNLVVFAGLWEPWNEEKSFTILTEEAKGELNKLHPRMPIMLEPDTAKSWVLGDNVNLNSNIYTHLQWHRVGKAVGNPRNQGKELIDKND